jgi:hypothetical protein
VLRAAAFARFRCHDCRREILVALSCKGRGFCPKNASAKIRFVPSPAPTDLDVLRLLTTVRRRIVRLVRRHGIDLEADPPEKHGPYHQLNFTWRGRSHTEFVREQDLAEVAATLDSYQQLRSLNEEWIDLGIERARLLREQRKRRSTAKPHDEKRPPLGNRRRSTRK